MTGFPKELRMRHRYVDQFVLTGAAGVTDTEQYRANGMYDPTVALGGHQPLYFDQLAAIYNHYTVLNSKLTLKMVAVGSMTQPAHVTLYVNDDTTVTSADPIVAAEQNSAAFGVALPDGNGTLTLSKKWSATEAFGPGALSDPNLQGSSAADPSEQQIFTIVGQAVDKASTWGYYCLVVIEYDAVWQELKDIAAS